MHTIYTSNAYEVYLMVYARVELNDYTNKVLNVIKAKYDLNDKSEALNKFAELYGEKEVEKQVSDKYVRKILRMEEQHFKKHGYKKMTGKELDKLFGK
jgi:hypothetical protein